MHRACVSSVESAARRVLHDHTCGVWHIAYGHANAMHLACASSAKRVAGRMLLANEFASMFACLSGGVIVGLSWWTHVCACDLAGAECAWLDNTTLYPFTVYAQIVYQGAPTHQSFFPGNWFCGDLCLVEFWLKIRANLGI
eukprot:1138632-Pelagomonas_calceolata.AAC.3